MTVIPEISAADWVSAGGYLDTSAGRVFFRTEGRGPTLVMLHGFPAWSYDWARVAPLLASEYRVVTLDFPGYGFSAKRRVDFSVAAAADAVEQVLRHLGVGQATLAIHDFGGIVGQELLDRLRQGQLSFGVDAIHVLNNGFVYAAYRPTRTQMLLATPVLGTIVARSLTKARLRAGLNVVRGMNKLDDAEFAELWVGMSRDDGYKLAHRHIRYNAERAAHHRRWEEALFGFDGPVQLIWGMTDPVSGRHVLELARPRLPKARIVELPKVGHFPQSEAPAEVVAAIRGAA